VDESRAAGDFDYLAIGAVRGGECLLRGARPTSGGASVMQGGPTERTCEAIPRCRGALGYDERCASKSQGGTTSPAGALGSPPGASERLAAESARGRGAPTRRAGARDTSPRALAGRAAAHATSRRGHVRAADAPSSWARASERSRGARMSPQGATAPAAGALTKPSGATTSAPGATTSPQGAPETPQGATWPGKYANGPGFPSFKDAAPLDQSRTSRASRSEVTEIRT